MPRWTTLTCLSLCLAAPSALQAQEPHFGFGLNLGFPTGEFRSKTYGPTATTPVPQTESYDVGLGAQFFVSFPLDPKLAFRVNLSGMTTDGSNTAPGLEKINLRHNITSVAGELQFFTGSAYRHRGTYFLLGLSADFERFQANVDDDHHGWYDDEDSGDVTRKSRLGATAGIGHTVSRGPGVRFTFELAYHKTLSGSSVSQGEPPATDFLKASIGWVF